MIRAGPGVPETELGMLAGLGLSLASRRAGPLREAGGAPLPDFVVTDASDSRACFAMFWARDGAVQRDAARSALERAAAWRRTNASVPAAAQCAVAVLVHPCDATVAVQVEAAASDVDVVPVASLAQVKETLDWARRAHVRRAEPEAGNVNAEMLEALEGAVPGLRRPRSEAVMDAVRSLEAAAALDVERARRLGAADVHEFFRRPAVAARAPCSLR